jgi:hypothetical protein
MSLPAETPSGWFWERHAAAGGPISAGRRADITAI